jgi:hypothetical protein
MPATVEGVRTFLGLSPARPVDDDALAAAVAGANDWVTTVRPDLTADPDAWAPRADEAATLEAARLYGRRGSVSGVVGFQEGGALALPSIDPDAQTLLELGRYQRSVVA